MITKDNLKYAISTVNPDRIKIAINGSKDYIKFELHMTNTGSYSTIEETDYNKEDEHNLQSNGQIYCDKDTFLQLLEDIGVMPFKL